MERGLLQIGLLGPGIIGGLAARLTVWYAAEQSILMGALMRDDGRERGQGMR